MRQFLASTYFGVGATVFFSFALAVFYTVYIQEWGGEDVIIPLILKLLVP